MQKLVELNAMPVLRLIDSTSEFLRRVAISVT